MGTAACRARPGAAARPSWSPTRPERVTALTHTMSSPSEGFKRIAPNVKLGRDVRIYDFTNLYGCEVGDETKIGAFVEIQKGAKIGSRCKISSHTFICEGVTIESEVFVGHNVTFINDRFPRATNASGDLKTEEEWDCQRTLIKRGASIGSGATLLGGITVGENAAIGAGSVVTKDVAPNTTVVGNPAKLIARPGFRSNSVCSEKI